MRRINFNQGWAFQRATADSWQAVDLPHDAMFTEKRDPDCANGANTGYFPGGKYLHRKGFDAPADWMGKCVLLEFEGVYRNSTVEINGNMAGGHRYGYTNFSVDAAPYLAFGSENEIVVTADNSEEPNSRWYSGSDIYNNVKLIVGNKTHIDLDGIKIFTKSIDPAIIEIKTKFTDGDNLHPEVRTEISFDGKMVATGSGAKQQIEIKEPALWSDEPPNLYHIKVMLVVGEMVVDED